MPRRSYSRHAFGLKQLVSGHPSGQFTMEITIVYDDAPTRRSAGRLHQRIESLLGSPGVVRTTWWKLSDLQQPGVLAGAVYKAIRSEMIVIAVNQSEGLPLPFYFWINSWLPHRTSGAGALVALLGAPEVALAGSGRLKNYLQVVARTARMDLLVAEYAQPRHIPESKHSAKRR